MRRALVAFWGFCCLPAFHDHRPVQCAKSFASRRLSDALGTKTASSWCRSRQSRGVITIYNSTPLALNRTIYQLEMMPEKSITYSRRWMRYATISRATPTMTSPVSKERARSHRFTSIPVKVSLQRSAGGPLCHQPVPLSRRGSQRLQASLWLPL